MVLSPDSFPFLVIGNKSDLDATQRVVSKEAANKYVKNLGTDIGHIEASARDNTNVAEAFERIAS